MLSPNSINHQGQKVFDNLNVTPNGRKEPLLVPSKKKLLVRFILENSKAVFMTLVFGLLANLFIIVLPVSIGKYYDLLFDFHSKRAIILDVLPSGWTNTVPHYLIFFLALVLLRMLFSFLQKFYTDKMGELFSKKLRETLFAHQLAMNMNIYDEKGVGKYLLRYSGDMNSMRTYFTTGVIRFGIDLVLLLLSILAMCWISLSITTVLLLGMFLTGLIVYFLNKRLYEVSLKRRNQKSGLLSFVSQKLPQMLTLKAFNRGPIEEKDFNKRSDKIYKVGVEFQAVINLIQVLIPSLLYLTLGAALLVIYLIQQENPTLDSGVLLAFILLVITIMPVMRRVLRVSSKWKVGNISFSKYLDVLQIDSDQQNADEPDIIFQSGEIDITNLDFSYANGPKVLRGFNLHIEGGKTTHIYTSKSFPKSTLIKLILGIYTPLKGDVSVDGQNINTINYKSLRRKIAPISEDFQLTGKTVFEAVSYSKANNKKPGVQNLLDVLQAGIPDSEVLRIDDVIGSNGDKLTKSQNKLLLFARGVATNKPILIIENLSEYATASYYHTLIQYLESLKKKGKTILLLDSTSHDEIKKLAHESIVIA